MSLLLCLYLSLSSIIHCLFFRFSFLFLNRPLQPLSLLFFSSIVCSFADHLASPSPSSRLRWIRNDRSRASGTHAQLYTYQHQHQHQHQGHRIILYHSTSQHIASYRFISYHHHHHHRHHITSIKTETDMSLKAELETWAAALQAYDDEDFDKSLELFSVRLSPSFPLSPG